MRIAARAGKGRVLATGATEGDRCRRTAQRKLASQRDMSAVPLRARAFALAIVTILLEAALLPGGVALAALDDSEFHAIKVTKLSNLDALVTAAPDEHNCVLIAQSIASARRCVLPPAPGRLLPTWAEPNDAQAANAGKLPQYKGVLLGFLGSLLAIERDERVCVNGANRLHDILDCEDEANRKTIYVGTLGGSAMKYVLLQ